MTKRTFDFGYPTSLIALADAAIAIANDPVQLSRSGLTMITCTAARSTMSVHHAVLQCSNVSVGNLQSYVGGGHGGCC